MPNASRAPTARRAPAPPRARALLALPGGCVTSTGIDSPSRAAKRCTSRAPIACGLDPGSGRGDRRQRLGVAVVDVVERRLAVRQSGHEHRRRAHAALAIDAIDGCRQQGVHGGLGGPHLRIQPRRCHSHRSRNARPAGAAPVGRTPGPREIVALEADHRLRLDLARPGVHRVKRRGVVDAPTERQQLPVESDPVGNQRNCRRCASASCHFSQPVSAADFT